MSLAEDILATNDRVGVEVHAWGKTLRVVPLSGVERDAYDVERYDARKAGAKLTNWRAKYLVRCLFDLEGNRVFTTDQADALGGKHAETIKRLFDVAEAVNEEGPTAVSDAAKNS